jgi:hypothetical protein
VVDLIYPEDGNCCVLHQSLYPSPQLYPESLSELCNKHVLVTVLFVGVSSLWLAEAVLGDLVLWRLNFCIFKDIMNWAVNHEKWLVCVFVHMCVCAYTFIFLCAFVVLNVNMFYVHFVHVWFVLHLLKQLIHGLFFIFIYTVVLLVVSDWIKLYDTGTQWNGIFSTLPCSYCLYNIFGWICV